MNMNPSEMKNAYTQALAEFESWKAKNLKLNMARGKPGADQLNLSMGMMDVLSSSDDLTCEDGTDCRNYGGHCGTIGGGYCLIG